ncbi:MAG: hypothetical protein WBD05_07470 [Phycisphaerae bacterium]
MDIEEATHQLRVECDNYDQTVQAIKALAHELLWVDKKKHLRSNGSAFIGRRMETSASNRISPENTVTPDLVVRTAPSHGVVAEAKLALAKTPANREEKLKQVQKYDDDLVGWDTPNEKVDSHDVLLVVHHFHGKQVQAQLREMMEAGQISFVRPFGLVCFGIVTQEEAWLSLELLEGHMSSGVKETKLANRHAMSLDHVAANPVLGSIALYDAEPPCPWLMHCIHEAIMSSALDDAEHLLLQEEGLVEKKISVEHLRDLLSDLFGPGPPADRTPEIPRTSWVRKAMSLFSKMGWAKRLAGHEYVFFIKNRRKPFEQFIKVCAEEQVGAEEKKKKEAEKMPLLREQIEHEG